MKDEIKEILDRLDAEEFELPEYSSPISWIEMFKIRDYITNLQEENDKALTDLVHESHKRIELENKITNLQEENKKLNDELKRLHNLLNSQAYQDLDDYKSRNERAIEYIGNGNIGIPKKTREKAIKILQGEDKDE